MEKEDKEWKLRMKRKDKEWRGKIKNGEGK